MSRTHIIKESLIERTPRVLQLEGLFDVPPSQRSAEEWVVDLDLPDVWNIGVIVGPSGSGKSTVARELFESALVNTWEWPEKKSILDGFPSTMGVKEIVDLLSSVGFSSPPSWVRPFAVLSNGEQFRVNMARTLAEMPSLAVVDEFTSVVDRTVAQIGSAAIAKTVRRRNQRFIAVSCHYDILDWLEPDWVYEPHTNRFQRGRLWRRPHINLEIKRVHYSAWSLFRKHHYLDTALNKASVCFVAFWGDSPVAFTAILPFPHPTAKGVWREHRTVCLPDFQGVGIGNRLSAYIGGLCRGVGYRFISQTGHPAMMQSRARSHDWAMRTAPTIHKPKGGARSTKTKWTNVTRKRMVASFEYVGPALDSNEATRVWGGRLRNTLDSETLQTTDRQATS